MGVTELGGTVTGRGEGGVETSRRIVSAEEQSAGPPADRKTDLATLLCLRGIQCGRLQRTL